MLERVQGIIRELHHPMDELIRSFRLPLVKGTISIL